MAVIRKRIKAVACPLPPDDPRNPDHPDQRERWLEFMEQLGRAQADLEYEQTLKGDGNETDKGGS